MLGFLITRDARAVIRSLDEEPSAWSGQRGGGGQLISLTHRHGLFVLAVYRPSGVTISEWRGGRSLFGATLLSVLGLSLSHWALSNAIDRWERQHWATPPVRSAADIMSGPFKALQ